MKKITKYILILILTFQFTGCSKETLEWPFNPNIILPNQVWNDEVMIIGLLADYYDRIPIHYNPANSNNMADGDEAVHSSSNFMDLKTYSWDYFTLWNYTPIRDINLAIEGLAGSTVLTAAQKEKYTAEFRFLRAYHYFEMVKRMGGVPIITTQLIYDYRGDPSYLAFPRNKESEVYEFIASECDAIKDQLGNADSKDRANKYTALALKCRAMLYAGSIAKYNNLLSTPITTAGGEVGIPASKANGYYQAALDAAREIVASGKYSLYRKNTNPQINFYEAFTQVTDNSDYILNISYNITTKKNGFPYANIPRSVREDNLSGSQINPSLNLVEAFDYTDGTTGALKGVGDGTLAGQARWIFYDKIDDIFKNKDPRLYGTVIYPGNLFKGKDVNIQAGVYQWEGNKYVRYESSQFGSLFTDGKLLTGLGGPMRAELEVSNDGFYIKKFMDETPINSARAVGSFVKWPRFRYGEVLLNAGEAAFELGLVPEALTYFNEIRNRAGMPDFTAGTLTFDKIMNERRVELAFEDHRLWDLMRWRQAHVLWNGVSTNPNAMLYALYPYRVVDAAHPDRNGKYVFDKFVAPKFLSPRFFQMGNYYNQIPQSVLDNNPTIVKNPYH
ncbi:MAG TPA: RagB/SusD family nutrient uptake outer membrane protein [Bacteroidales bacterium]|nr:RagB/SusD family nutrient uptake outer membrane protein [Bacteroidales bacterium]